EARNNRDRCEVALRIEWQFRIERWMRGQGRIEHHEEGMPVRRCLGHGLSANVARDTRPILNNERLFEGCGELLRQQARREVQWSASRERHDHRDCTARITLTESGFRAMEP